MSETSVPRGRDKHPPPLSPETGFVDERCHAELLEAAEAALAWMRDCGPMDDEERLDSEADLRVRLRRAIRGARRSS